MGCPNRSLLSKIEVFYRPEGTKEGVKGKWMLTIFKFKNKCYKQSGKNRWKWGYLSSFYVSFLSCDPLNYFSNFVLTSARNLLSFTKYLRQTLVVKWCTHAHTHTHTPASSHYTLSENGMGYRGLGYRSWILAFKI